MVDMKNKLQELVKKYKADKLAGNLNNASETTIRMWINNLLELFGWDVRNTHQVLQERRLGAGQRKRLTEIDSTNTRPDYTLVNGEVILSFIDAKGLNVNIRDDNKVSFQIRSYGWSACTAYSIVTNFEEFAVYDCTQKPSIGQSSSVARVVYLTIDDYVDHFDDLAIYLSRRSVINYTIVRASCPGVSLDEEFADYLRKFRIKLVQNIIDSGQSYGVESLGLWSQIIIDRIIFIRVCEARGLEDNGLLQKFKSQGFWESFRRSSYMEFYQHYDGPIFTRNQQIHNLDIEDSVFDDLIDLLYYPSPYRFDVIPLDVLSNIYELFLGYKLNVTDGKVAAVLKSEYKKQKGVVVTPSHIVQKVIDETLYPEVFESFTFDDILKLKFVDPACGSGVFLVHLFNRLYQKSIDVVPSNDDRLVCQKDGGPVLSLEAKRAIIRNCLYGVDIDAEAVEVTKMSLALRVIDGYSPEYFESAGLYGDMILSGIGDNIKCGNSLVSSDIFETNPELQQKIDELKETNVFDWHIAFPEVFANGGFDYVIGNPPYVEVKNYNVGLPTMASYIKTQYSASSNGKIDLVIPFIEKGIQLLNASGRLGYVVQKRFFKADYGKGIRRMLSTKRLLHSIYDYSETGLFKDRITYVAVIVCDKNIEHNDIVSYKSSYDDILCELPADVLDEPTWNFSDLDLMYYRIRASEVLGTLKDVCDIKVGLQVLYDKVYHIKHGRVLNGIIYGKSEIGDVSVELESCRKLLCNENFYPFIKPEYSTYAIFPYEMCGANVNRILFTDFSDRYPLAASYLLSQRSHLNDKVQLFPQKNPCDKPDDYWHLYTREQNHKEYDYKVCIPMTTQYPQATVINDATVYCDNANMAFGVIKGETSEVKLYALAAIINSSIFAVLARSIANPQQNGYYKFNKQFLSPVPFPKEKFLEESDEIVEIASIAKRIESIYGEISRDPARKGNFLSALNSLWLDLDNIAYRLYDVDIESASTSLLSSRNDRI